MKENKDINILIIDDEKSIRDILKKYLSYYKYNVYTAGTLLEGLDILKQKKCDILFLDLNLPDVSGVEFFRKHQKDFSDLCVVVMSVYYDEPDYIQEYVYKKSFDILKKPFDLDEIKKVIEKCLRRKENE